MIPRLFETTATSFEDSLSICFLTDCISCLTTEEINGEYTLTLTYPVNGANAKEIQTRRIITAIPSPYRDAQPFRIKTIEISKIGSNMNVYAEHISYDLGGYTFLGSSSDFYTSHYYISDLFKEMNALSPFTFSVKPAGDIDARNYGSKERFNYVPNTPKTLRELCGDGTGCILELAYDCCWMWDNYNCYIYEGYTLDTTGTIYPGRGSTTDLDIVFGKNMSTLSATLDSSNVYTHIKTTTNKVGDLSEDDKEIADGSVCAFYPSAPSTVTPGTTRILCIDCNSLIDNDLDGTSKEQRLKYLAKAYYSQIQKEPTWSITVGFKDINNAIGYRVWNGTEYVYKDKTIDLGDTVKVTYPLIGLEGKRSYISSETTDVLRERYNSITVGDISASLSRTISRWR